MKKKIIKLFKKWQDRPDHVNSYLSMTLDNSGCIGNIYTADDTLFEFTEEKELIDFLLNNSLHKRGRPAKPVEDDVMKLFDEWETRYVNNEYCPIFSPLRLSLYSDFSGKIEKGHKRIFDFDNREELINFLKTDRL